MVDDGIEEGDFPNFLRCYCNGICKQHLISKRGDSSQRRWGKYRLFYYIKNNRLKHFA